MADMQSVPNTASGKWPCRLDQSQQEEWKIAPLPTLRLFTESWHSAAPVGIKKRHMADERGMRSRLGPLGIEAANHQVTQPHQTSAICYQRRRSDRPKFIPGLLQQDLRNLQSASQSLFLTLAHSIILGWLQCRIPKAPRQEPYTQLLCHAEFRRGRKGPRQRSN